MTRKITAEKFHAMVLDAEKNKIHYQQGYQQALEDVHDRLLAKYSLHTHDCSSWGCPIVNGLWTAKSLVKDMIGEAKR